MEKIGEEVGEVIEGDIWKKEDIEIEKKKEKEIEQIIERMRKMKKKKKRVMKMIEEGIIKKKIDFEIGVQEEKVKENV